MRISIDHVMTILSVLGEEDTCVGFADNRPVQVAIDVLQKHLQAAIDEDDLSPSDILIEFH